MTSPYGYREYRNKGRLIQETHRGIDVVCTAFAGQSVPQEAWTVREVTGGRVLRVACDAQRGNYVDVQTQPDTFERYQHLARVDVRAGQTVAQGAVLGLAGSTGNSTGVHLHFGVYRGGSKEANAIEPSAWLGLPNRAGVYEGNDALDASAGAVAGGGGTGGANGAQPAGDDQGSGGADQSAPPCAALAVCRIGPASAGDRAALAELAAHLCLPYAETAV